MSEEYTTEERLAWWRNVFLLWLFAALIGVSLHLSGLITVLKQIAAALEAK